MRRQGKKAEQPPSPGELTCSALATPNEDGTHPCARCKGDFHPEALLDLGDKVICDGCLAELTDPSICTRDHIDVPRRLLSALPSSQRGRWRHRCAACAYEQGRLAGIQEERARAAREGGQR